MSQVFIRLYLDEDVDILLADLVRARGYSVTTTQEAGNLGRSDADQLAFAIHEQRAFFTHNRVDFETLAQSHFMQGTKHTGIIIAVRHPVYEIARRLLIILNQMTADEMENQIRYI